MKLLPLTLAFCADTMENIIPQISRMSLLPVHIHRHLWLKVWETDLACKICLLHMPFDGKPLFGNANYEYTEMATDRRKFTPHLYKITVISKMD